MKINTEMDHWKDIFQQKVKDFKPEGVSPDWNSFENKLNHKSSSSWSSRHWMIAAAGVVAILVPVASWLLSDSAEPVSKTTEQELLYSNSTQFAIEETAVKYVDNQDNKQATNSTVEAQQAQTIPSPAESQNTESTIPEKGNTHENVANSVANLNLEKSTQDEIPTPVSTFKLNLIEQCTPARVACIPDEVSSSYFYTWTTSDGQSSNQSHPTFTFNQAGNVTISLVVNNKNTKQSGQFKESHVVEVYETPVSDFNVDREKLTYIFRPKNMDYPHYNWKIADLSSEETEISYAFVKSGTYSVELYTESDKACHSKTSKEIKVEVIHPIFIGNAFTPDGDGNNDFFGPKSEALIDYEYRFEVYNRISQLVFVSTDPFILWDGKIMGVDEALEGFYLYKIYTKDKYGNSQVKTGDVLLIRKK